MKTHLLALVVVIGGMFFVSSPQAEAQILVPPGGAPAFRAAQFRPDGPQPFSTRRGRELQAARSRGISTGGVLNRSTSLRYQRPLGVFQRSRTVLFSRRFR